MPTPPRFIPPSSMVEITCRTIEGRCLLRPTPGFTRRVNGVIGRALHLYPVSLHAYQFLSNHVHIDISSPDADLLSRFESLVLGATAKIAQELTGWRGPVWERCQPIPILDEPAAEQRLRYLLANGTKEGLVGSPLEWPGPSAARALCSGRTLEGVYALKRHGRLVEVVSYPIRLTPIPSWLRLTAEERSARARAMIDEIAIEALQARGGRPPLGVDGILATDPFAPVPLERHPPPLCHATDDLVRREFLVARRAFLDAHRLSSARFRTPPHDSEFPPHAFLPPTYRG